MLSHRSYLNPVTRDLDITSVMIAPDPPGPLATDKHDGVVDAFPVAHINTTSTAHNLEQFTKPSNNPNINNNDALVMDLASYISKHHRDEAGDASSIVSSESHHLCDEEPVSNSVPHQHNPFQPGGDDSMTFAINDLAAAAVGLAGAQVPYASAGARLKGPGVQHEWPRPPGVDPFQAGRVPALHLIQRLADAADGPWLEHVDQRGRDPAVIAGGLGGRRRQRFGAGDDAPLRERHVGEVVAGAEVAGLRIETNSRSATSANICSM